MGHLACLLGIVAAVSCTPCAHVCHMLMWYTGSSQACDWPVTGLYYFTGLSQALYLSQASHWLMYRPVTGLWQACHRLCIFHRPPTGLRTGQLQASYRPVTGSLYFTGFSQASHWLIYRPVTGLSHAYKTVQASDMPVTSLLLAIFFLRVYIL